MGKWTAQTSLAKTVFQAGFSYDPSQDIIYSNMWARQHALGYCWAYDESSAIVEMIIDCEPFYFVYHDHAWMIELWKGQYGLETGCEIGVYREACNYFGAPTVDPANFRSRFYRCVERNPQQMLHMRSALYCNGKLLFQRTPQLHWWLTGFKWGVFTQDTHDLVMRVQITFPTEEMCSLFKLAAYMKMYSLTPIGKESVAFSFQYPHTPQPASRIALQTQMQAQSMLVVEYYNQYKKDHQIASNDPNLFTFSQYEAPAEQLLAGAAAKAGKVASSAASVVEHQTAHLIGSIHHQASHVASVVHHEVAHVAAAAKSAASNDVVSLQKKLLGFFGNNSWHCQQHAKRVG